MNDTSLKQSQHPITCIILQVHYALSKRVNDFKRTPRGEACIKLGIPILSHLFVLESVAEKSFLNPLEYQTLTVEEKVDAGYYQLKTQQCGRC